MIAAAQTILPDAPPPEPEPAVEPEPELAAESQPESAPESAPKSAPDLEAEPVAEPAAEPAPAVEPEPEPEPESAEPEPGPAAESEPATAPEPAAAFEPRPEPEPEAPEPEPAATSAPERAPEPAAAFEPPPEPEPEAPEPEPKPGPVAEFEPETAPEPAAAFEPRSEPEPEAPEPEPAARSAPAARIGLEPGADPAAPLDEATVAAARAWDAAVAGVAEPEAATDFPRRVREHGPRLAAGRPADDPDTSAGAGHADLVRAIPGPGNGSRCANAGAGRGDRRSGTHQPRPGARRPRPNRLRVGDSSSRCRAGTTRPPRRAVRRPGRGRIARTIPANRVAADGAGDRPPDDPAGPRPREAPVRPEARVRVLVTGGAGYVGGVSVDALLAAGHEVVVLDDLTTGHAAAVPAEAPLVRGSYGDERPVAPAPRVASAIDAILHCAARSLVGECVRDPARYYRDNVAGGVALLEAARAAGVGRLVFSSTAAVYGVPDSHADRGGRPAPPDQHRTARRSARSRARCAGTARRTGSAQRRPALLQRRGRHARAWARSTDPETHLHPERAAAAEGGPALTLFGDDYPTPDGTPIRDYIHVEDLADAHLAALEATDAGRRADRRPLVCNLGTSAAVLGPRGARRGRARVVGHAIPHTVGPRRAGDPPVLVASNDRAAEVAGLAARAARPSTR